MRQNVANANLNKFPFVRLAVDAYKQGKSLRLNSVMTAQTRVEMVVFAETMRQSLRGRDIDAARKEIERSLSLQRNPEGIYSFADDSIDRAMREHGGTIGDGLVSGPVKQIWHWLNNR